MNAAQREEIGAIWCDFQEQVKSCNLGYEPSESNGTGFRTFQNEPISPADLKTRFLELARLATAMAEKV